MFEQVSRLDDGFARPVLSIYTKSAALERTPVLCNNKKIYDTLSELLHFLRMLYYKRKLHMSLMTPEIFL